MTGGEIWDTGTQTPACACSLTKFPPSHTHVYLLLVALGTRFVLTGIL